MQISIQDVLGIESLSIDLKAPINFIVGENEAGKSSIKDSIQWGFTGSARGQKTQNEQAALIRDGGKAADVTISTSNGIIRRKKTPKTHSGVVGPVPKDQEIAAISCDPLTYLSFPDETRREILFRIIPGLHPTLEEIEKRLTDWLTASEEPLNDLAKLALNELAELAASKGFKSAAEEAVTRRRIAKALLKEAKVEEPEQRAKIGDKEFILPDYQKAEVEEGLANLQKIRDELLQKKGKSMGDTDDLPKLEKELADLEADPIEPPKSGEVERLQVALEASRRCMAGLQKQVDNLGPGKAPKCYPAICPAFPGYEQPCPKARQTAIAGKKAAEPAEIEKVQGFLTNEQEKVERLKKEFQDAQAKQNAYEQHPQKCRDLTANIARLKTQAAMTAEVDKEIAVLDSRMKVGQDLLAEVIRFWQQKDAADAAAAKMAKAEKEAILYDALAKALAPEGIPSRMIAEALKPMNDLLQVVAVHLFPGRTLMLTKELEIDLSGSPFVTLSKSAKFRVGVAFQYALTRLAGARLLMIDEADILDPGNRGKLIDFLLAVRQDFDTILVFATSDHADPSPVPEIQVWWLEKGKIKPVSQPMAA
ncbi:MAG: AAA family ATPase [Desulfobaccales bacterium]